MVRFFASLVVLGSLCTFVVGCGDDPLQPFADVRWRLRCQGMGGCTGYMARDINNYNGEESRRISCQVQARGDGTREFFFQAYQGSSYGIQMGNASFRGEGGAVGGACFVRVLEDGSNWEGACGSSPPSMTQPCQITDFRIDPMMGVLGKVQCAMLPLSGDPSRVRELTSPDETTPYQPAAFNLQNCSGL